MAHGGAAVAPEVTRKRVWSWCQSVVCNDHGRFNTNISNPIQPKNRIDTLNCRKTCKRQSNSNDVHLHWTTLNI